MTNELDLNQGETAIVPVVVTGDRKLNQQVSYPKGKDLFTLFFVSLFFMIVCGMFGGIVLASVHGAPVNLTLVKPIVDFVIYIASMLLIIRYAKRKSRKHANYAPVRLGSMPLKLLPLILVSALAFFVIDAQSSSFIPMPAAIQKLFDGIFTKDIFSVLTAVIAAPILEEILCRGIVLKGLLNNYPPAKAILFSSIFFAALHLNPWQGIPGFLGGLFIGWIYYKTRSIIPGIIIHATINCGATLFLFAPSNKQNMVSLWGMQNYLVLLGVAMIIFAGACMLLQKKIMAL